MDISVTGAKIYYTIPILGGIPITETIVNTWIIMAVITLLCIWLTRGLKVRPTSKKQAAAEFLYKTATNFVEGNMGKSMGYYTPFVSALFALSALSSLSSLLGMYPPTADLNTELSWALLVFVLIIYTKIKTGGVLGYVKGFVQPIPVLLPFNIISEVATPISMAFRHFGNIASGSVITSMIYAGLAVLSHALLSWLPGFIKSIPIFQLGIPAVFSIYFDLFSSFLQAFIFCMLTMMYIAAGAETSEE